MGFFDFLGQTTRYRHRQGGLRRLNLRHEFLITPYLKDIAGARVLDLASQDGRWAYALAEAGAREVVGIEARPELVRQYDEYPESPVKERTRLVVRTSSRNCRGWSPPERPSTWWRSTASTTTSWITTDSSSTSPG